MKISVENFGPIAVAKNIELRPLTVFVGPSNTGKSYLAALIYALSKSRMNIGLFSTTYIDQPEWDFTDSELSYWDKLITSVLNKGDIRILDWPEELESWTTIKIAEKINRIFHQEISRCMGTVKNNGDLIKNQFKLCQEDNYAKLTLGSSGSTIRN